MDEANILFAGRLAERLLVVFFGGLSLTFGWHLFKIGVVKPQSAELSRKDIVFRLRKVGPGVFFALFGAAILAVSLDRPLVLSDTTPEDGNSSAHVSYYSKANEAAVLQDVKALNTQLHIITPAGLERLSKPEGQADLEDLLRTRDTIEGLRNYLVIQKFGSNALRMWKRYGEDFLHNAENVPAQHRNLLTDMVDWMKDTL